MNSFPIFWSEIISEIFERYMYFCKINSTPCCLSENIAYLCKVVQTTDIYSWCVSLTPCIRNLVNFKMEAGPGSNTCHMYPYANDMRYRCGVLFSFICFRVLPEPLIQISKPAPHFFCVNITSRRSRTTRQRNSLLFRSLHPCAPNVKVMAGWPGKWSGNRKI